MLLKVEVFEMNKQVPKVQAFIKVTSQTLDMKSRISIKTCNTIKC